ncbi:MAG: hypothetical protein UHK60_10930 [Acutalibacteraceae bacterium]|nr:hypothetical protein [Acutalibacteraceae bacterium]
MAQHKIDFKDQKTSEGTITYYSSFKSSFNKDLNKTQVYLDKLVATNLRPYVSRKTGTQEYNTQSYNEGSVTINVPYAEYQAYSKRIKKRVGKRGTRPFERMVADKKGTILKQVQEYARRLNG